jgi:transcriptional regulator with XRE-family HTH domain
VSVRENIAANLRQLCAERGSISRICHEAGFNRQQFNRYLTGATIPNRASLAKLCRYFEVTESDIFQDPDIFVQPVADTIHDRQPNAPWQAVLEDLEADTPANIPDGAYHVCFAMPGNTGDIARSALFIRTEGNFKTFRRITNITEDSIGRLNYFQGNHKGVVLDRCNWLNFVGIANDGIREPSMITVQRLNVGPLLYSGCALVFGISEPLLMPVVIEALPAQTSTRQVLRGCGMFGRNTSRIKPMTKAFLASQRAGLAAGLLPQEPETPAFVGPGHNDCAIEPVVDHTLSQTTN